MKSLTQRCMSERCLGSFTAFGAVLLVVVIVLPGFAIANPSSKDPDRPMALHGTIAGSSRLAKSADLVCAEAQKMLIELQEGIERGDRRPKHKVETVMDMVASLWKARRDGAHCAAMGEPYGGDLQVRASYLSGPLKAALLASNRQNNEVARAKAQSIKRLTRGKKGLLRFIDQAKAGLAAGKYKQVEREMESRGIGLYRDTFLLTNEERNRLVASFFIVLNSCDVKVAEQRRREYGALAEEKAQEELAKLESFSQECRRIIGEIKESKTANLAKDQSGDAADAFEYLFSRWGAASAAVLRAHAIQFPFTRSGRTEARKTLRELESSAIPLLTELIDTAAEVNEPTEVATIHPRILASTTMAARRMKFPSDFVKACQASLDAMAAKNPEFESQILRYEEATREALRWRKEFSTQRSASFGTKVKPIAGIMGQEVSRADAYRPPFRSKKVIPPKKRAPARTQYPSHLLVRHLAKGLLGRTVRLEVAIRPSTKLPICVVPYKASHYANVLVSEIAAKAVKDLEHALLVDANHPALSFEASDAVSAAQLHDYEQVGGVIKGVRVEGEVTRFINLSSGAYVLYPLGDVPNFDENFDPIYNRCYRFDLEPVWLKHKYFIVGKELQ